MKEVYAKSTAGSEGSILVINPPLDQDRDVHRDGLSAANEEHEIQSPRSRDRLFSSKGSVMVPCDHRCSLITHGLVITLAIVACSAAAGDQAGNDQTRASNNLSTGLTWSPTNPEIGETVLLTVTGHPGDLVTEWDFGEEGCPGHLQFQTCEPAFGDCSTVAFQYASGGMKTVQVVVRDPDGGTVLGSASEDMTVADTGNCSGTPTCAYSISPNQAIFAPPAATGSFEVTTNHPDCGWFATSNATWVVVTNGNNHMGSGSLEYAVAENNTPHQRATTISITGAGSFSDDFTIIQNHPWIPVDFDFNVFSPEIGETVTYTTDPRLEVLAWHFSSQNCQGQGPTITCSGAAGDCSEVQWAWAEPGEQDVTMETTTGSQTKTLTVRDTGQCPEACGGVGPDDGTAENGYGWGTGSTFVQRFTPDSYPWVVTDVCFALTQAAGDTSVFLSLIVADDDGPDGSPGSFYGSVFAQIGDVPAWLEHRFYSLPMPGDTFRIEDGSIYIGVFWYQHIDPGFFIAADESPATPPQIGYFIDGSTPWIPLSSAFPSYRSLLLRTEGYPVFDGEWQLVVGSDRGGGNGFGASDNEAAAAMELFDGELFLGTANPHGAGVHLTEDGEVWWPVADPGLGDPTNLAIPTLMTFGDHLYAATRNPTLGAEVWRTNAAPNWSIVDGAGFGDPGNISAPSGTVFNGHLYLGTDSYSGCEIWRSSDGVTWTQVNLDGFGNPYNQVATAMAVDGGELFVGTLNSNGAEIWKSSDGIAWTPAMTGGFGSTPNLEIGDLEVFNGTIYAGTSNPVTGAQIWRSFDASTWFPVVQDGFGKSGITTFDAFAVGDLGIYASISGPADPGAIWFSIDGTNWEPSSSPGFFDQSNTAIGDLTYWDNRVFAGTVNPASGCEVWRGARHSLFQDDFESGDTGGWTAVTP